MTHKSSITLFLGAGASVCESFPTVFQFFERVKFPDGADARGFQTACQELARRIAVAERTQENSQWPRFDAEKLWGNLELLVNSNKLTSVPFGLPVTHSGLSPQNTGVAPEDLLAFLKEQILRIYGRSVSTPSEPCPHRDLFALFHEIVPPDEPISVYTTNYDTIVEDFFQSPRFSEETFHSAARVCTGFSQGNPGRWKPELFDAEIPARTRQVNLFKLHGSVTWKWESTGSVLAPVEINWRQPTGDTDCLLYFGYKSVPERDPFKTLHNRFKDSLVGSSVVFVVGFQFADPYIRETFDFALRANPNLKIVCCLKDVPAMGTPLSSLMCAFPGRVQVLARQNKAPIAFGEDEFSQALRTVLSAD
ncbi:MAG TPA: SIR2 family protein [Candidatus Sulfotelmatobacter sp.]|nr:SIR2 family protein [Candidatus Sulfotelmatobacter sp.]